jgi:hypothetical protein
MSKAKSTKPTGRRVSDKPADITPDEKDRVSMKTTSGRISGAVDSS